jgi:benzoyl-CoA reductase/2-hydroxyglutaryl-CoA dehydratase subunit BcrC/BadD/HgdB
MRVFYACTWIPVEWIKAHGHQPCGVWALRGLVGQPLPMPEGVCPFAQAVLSLAETQSESAFIFPTSCDQMRRAFDAAAAAGRGRVFLFNLPATWQTPVARRLYRDEVDRLGKFFERLGGHAPTSAELKAVMSDFDTQRAKLRSFIAHGGARQSSEAIASFFSNDALNEPLFKSGRGQPAGRHQSPTAPDHDAGEDTGAPASTGSRVPLALVGGPLLHSQWALFDAIESAGGRVVLNAAEPGERCLLSPLPGLADDQDPLTVLTDHYFDHCVDVFQRPNTRLYDWLRPRLAEKAVRGIVLWVPVGCDLWHAEAASLREAFRLPVLMLESDETSGGSLRNANRLGAFLEALHPRVQPSAAYETKGCTGPNSANWPPLAS